MQITKEMKKAITEKEKKNTELTKLCNKLVDLEIKEATKRVTIMNKLEAEATANGKKITEKSKVAKCDAELKDLMIDIKWLKNDISTLKRDIELCDDKISLHRNRIRELELSSH